ncbi:MULTISPECIES: RecX family transcriptional regulator [Legionella]|uniref:Recombination regulator RecX n=1 Tax=Legionella maceachernii TaxID=466 RepID=A0A0W0WDX9_9GAMM|nr:RecX family transcriptional regulator [Legionella maceachernii]KTD30580.1 recombination regulator RecX [Legionella maceachernii]SJZ97489.1 regulatory protein [Legionella maceachernii]SUP01074.1 recombination regulator RecX [Legionella maceachernii]
MDIMTTSLSYLSEMPRSEKAVREYLENKFGKSRNTLPRINSVLNCLKKERLIDDGRLAYSLAYHYAHKGDQFIIDLLKEKGINDKVITNTLAQLDSEILRAMKEIKKRFHGEFVYSEKTISFISRFLQGRRFSHLTTRAIIQKLSIQNPCNKKVA